MRKPNEEWVHYPITPLLSSNNAESLMTAALHGMGIVLFPDWLIGEALKQGDLIKLLPEYEVAIKSHPSISQPFIPMSAIHHLILEQ